MALLNKVITDLLCASIMLYRLFLSPVLRPRCRFLPTCSSYGIEAIRRWGWQHGGRLFMTRLLKCHPWGGSGYDAVPPAPVKYDK